MAPPESTGTEHVPVHNGNIDPLIDEVYVTDNRPTGAIYIYRPANGVSTSAPFTLAQPRPGVAAARRLASRQQGATCT